MPALVRGQSQGESDMGFARAAVAEQKHVLAAGEELRSRQLQQQGLVQRRDGEEVASDYAAC
jgi:hypothetical protein